MIMESFDFLKASGWFLSPEGLALCLKACKEKGWTPSAKTVPQVALNLDLKTIAADLSSPDDPSRCGGIKTHRVDGPIVLQVQRVKNVAVPSNKQHDPSPSKRLLRLQLSDGHTHIGAAEIEGPIEKLSPATPPGTKVRIIGNVPVVNGFILLKKSSIEVLGGNVEVLLTKWNLMKAMPDNIGREKGGNEDGPPQFVRFNKMSGDIQDNNTNTKQIHNKPPQIPEAISTRERMELPDSYRIHREDGGSKGGKVESKLKLDIVSTESRSRQSNPGNVKSDGTDYTPSPSEYVTKTDDIEDIAGPRSGGGRGGRGSRGGRSMNRGGRYSSRGGHEVGGPEGRKEDLSDGRESRGRGRRYQRDQDDDYVPQRNRDPYKLSDYFRQLEGDRKVDREEENVLEDYVYDAKSDRYFMKGSIPDDDAKPDRVADEIPKEHEAQRRDEPFRGRKGQGEGFGTGEENRKRGGNNQYGNYDARGERVRNQYDTRGERRSGYYDKRGQHYGHEDGRGGRGNILSSRGRDGRSQNDRYGRRENERGHHDDGREGRRRDGDGYGKREGDSSGRREGDGYPGYGRGEDDSYGRRERDGYGRSGYGRREGDGYGKRDGDGYGGGTRQGDSYGRRDGGRRGDDGYERRDGDGYGRREGGMRQGDSYGRRDGDGYGRREGGRRGDDGYGRRDGDGYGRREGGTRQGDSYGRRDGDGYGRREGGRRGDDGYGRRDGDGYGRREGGTRQGDSYGRRDGDGYGKRRGDSGRSQQDDHGGRGGSQRDSYGSRKENERTSQGEEDLWEHLTGKGVPKNLSS